MRHRHLEHYLPLQLSEGRLTGILLEFVLFRRYSSARISDPGRCARRATCESEARSILCTSSGSQSSPVADGYRRRPFIFTVTTQLWINIRQFGGVIANRSGFLQAFLLYQAPIFSIEDQLCAPET